MVAGYRITTHTVGGYRIAARISFVKAIMPKSLNMPHSLPLHGTRFAHWSIWSDPSEAAGQSWQIQQLFLQRNRATQESCGTEMTHYAEKHVVDYCSTIGVVHVVVQLTLHRECQEKRVGAESWDIYNHHQLCQTSKFRHRGH